MQSKTFEVKNISSIAFINAKSLLVPLHMDQIPLYNFRNLVNAPKKKDYIFSWKKATIMKKEVLRVVIPTICNIVILNLFVLYVQSITINKVYLFASLRHSKYIKYKEVTLLFSSH